MSGWPGVETFKGGADSAETVRSALRHQLRTPWA